MTSSMLVPFVFGPGDLRLCDVPVPLAGPRDIVLQVGYVGVCGSDLGYIAKGGVAGPTEEPIPLGHELSAIVEEVGQDVTAFSVGDRVVVNPLVNLIGNGAAEGGFAERLLIRDVADRPQSLLRLPDKLSLEHGALVEPLAVGMHAANRAGVRKGDKIAIFGAGPIGLCSLVAMRARGIDDIVVFDLSPFRRDVALKLGACAAFDPQETSPEKALRKVHGTVALFRADAPATTHYIEASGAPVLVEIVEIARERAVVCIVSLHKKTTPIDFAKVMAKELTFTGALGYPREMDDVLLMLENNAPDLEALISHRFDAPDVLEAFSAASSPETSAKVLVRYAG